MFNKNGISGYTNGKDIKKLLPYLSSLHAQLMDKNGLETEQIGITIYDQLYQLSLLCRKTMVWNNLMLDMLQTLIVAFKTNLITRFGKNASLVPIEENSRKC